MFMIYFKFYQWRWTCTAAADLANKHKRYVFGAKATFCTPFSLPAKLFNDADARSIFIAVLFFALAYFVCVSRVVVLTPLYMLGAVFLIVTLPVCRFLFWRFCGADVTGPRASTAGCFCPFFSVPSVVFYAAYCSANNARSSISRWVNVAPSACYRCWHVRGLYSG